MQKVISLFKRDYEGTRLVYDETVEGAEWVINGEGVATEKFDGTACLIKEGRLYKRYDVKKDRLPPPDFQEAQAPDPITGHWPGWIPISIENPADRWHLEGLVNTQEHKDVIDGTYELVGPKVQGNKYELSRHYLWPHGKQVLPDAPRNFEAIREYLEKHSKYEGIVWWHPDGRLVKIKRRDFGLKW